MTQRIEVPGMGVVEFPAGMSDEEIAQAIQRNLGSSGSGSALGTAKEIGKVAGSAVYGGLTAIPRLVMEGGNWLEKTFPTPEWSQIPIPGYEAMAGADARVREALRPESRMGRSAANVGEAAVSTLAGPGALTTPLRLAGIGAASGVGSEIAQAAMGEGVLPSVLGGLTGGVAGGLASAAKTNRGALAREALEGVRPDDLAEGLARMEAARGQGFHGNIAQFMPAETNLDSYMNALAGSRHGTITQQQLRDQPRQIADRMQREVAGLPGEHLPTRLVANEAQEAATEVLEQTRRRAGEAWRAAAPDPDATFPELALTQLDARLARIAREHPNTHRAEMAEDVRQVLRVTDPEAPTIPGPDGQPIPNFSWNDNVLNLKDSIYQQLDTFGSRKLNTTSGQAVDQRAAQEIRGLFNEMVSEFAPELRKANEAYGAVMQTFNTQRKSITGDIAGRVGAQVDVNAPQGKLMAMFDAGTVPGAPSEILTLERDFRRAGQQEAFLNAAKTWIADRASRAVTRPTPSSRAPDDVAINLLRTFGDPRSLQGSAGQKAAQGFDDVLAGMARAQGLEAAETANFVKGFKNFMTIVADLSNRPARAGGVSRSAIEEKAQSGLTRNIGQVSIITPLRQPALAWARHLEQDALSTIDRLMTSPEGVRTLVELGKTRPFSQKALTTFGTFLGTTAATVESDN